MNTRLATIGDFVEPVATWNPATRPEQSFVYVDLSAVDQIEKEIISASSIVGAEAPSRARQLIKNGDVLVSTVRPNLNGVAPVTESYDGATASTGFCVLRPRHEELYSSYLMHWVRSPQFVESMTRQATGASYPAVTDRIVKNSSIPIPPLNEQRRIAAILDKASMLRRKRRIALGLTDLLAHKTYEHLFGDPVRNSASLPMTTLGELGVDMAYGPRFYNEEYSTKGVRIVRITDLSEAGDLDYSSMPRLNVSERDIEAHGSRPGELLFARTGATVGKIALIGDGDPVSIPGAYFIRLRFPSSVDPLYAWYTLRSPSIQELIVNRSRQSAQQNFSGPGLRRLPFTIPPMSEQKTFTKQISKIRKVRSIQLAQVPKLESLFSSLQSRAFSGQL